MTNTLEAVVDRWEGDDAVLKTADGQELLWPGSDLADDIEEGAIVYLSVRKDKEATTDAQDNARAILNEIFSPENT